MVNPRDFRIFNFAVFDFAMTFIGTLVIMWLFKVNITLKKTLVNFVLMILIGIIVHHITETPTQLNKLLGLN